MGDALEHTTVTGGVVVVSAFQTEIWTDVWPDKWTYEQVYKILINT